MFTAFVRILLTSTFLCAGVLAAPATASVDATEDWTAVVVLSRPGRAVAPDDVAVGANGDMAATWAMPDGSLWVALRVAGAGWQSVVRVVSNGRAISPQVGYVGGRLLLAWAENAGAEPSGGPAVMKVRRMLASGTWGPERIVAHRRVGRFESLDLDVAQHGAAVIGCQWVPTTEGTAPRMFNRALAVTMHAWAWQRAVAWKGVVFNQVEVAPTGVAAVSMVAVHESRPPAFRVARHTSTGWGAPETVGRSGHGWGVEGAGIAVDNAGTTTAAWMIVKEGPHWQLRVSRARPGQGWSAPQTVNRSDVGTSFPLEVMATKPRRVLIVWSADNGEVLAVRRPAGGPWEDAVSLRRPYPDADAGYAPRVEVDTDMQPSGRAIVTWSSTSILPRGGVRVRVMEPNGAWGPATLLSLPSRDAASPTVAMRHRDTAVAWARRVASGADRYRVVVRTHSQG